MNINNAQSVEKDRGILSKQDSRAVDNDKANNILSSFVEIYGKMSSENLHLLDDIYDDNIVFCDPIHQIDGLSALRNYLGGMYQNVSNYEIDILTSIGNSNAAFLEWTMKFSHPSLNKGNQIEFAGVSKLKFNEKVYFHQDYYDLGAMLYEHIPLFGSLVKKIKQRAAR